MISRFITGIIGRQRPGTIKPAAEGMREIGRRQFAAILPDVDTGTARLRETKPN